MFHFFWKLDLNCFFFVCSLSLPFLRFFVAIACVFPMRVPDFARNCFMCSLRAHLCELDRRSRMTAASTEDDDGGPDWLVDPLHISQLKEQYRRERAKNRKGLVARKFIAFPPLSIDLLKLLFKSLIIRQLIDLFWFISYISSPLFNFLPPFRAWIDVYCTTITLSCCLLHLFGGEMVLWFAAFPFRFRCALLLCNPYPFHSRFWFPFAVRLGPKRTALQDMLTNMGLEDDYSTPSTSSSSTSSSPSSAGMGLHFQFSRGGSIPHSTAAYQSTSLSESDAFCKMTIGDERFFF